MNPRVSRSSALASKATGFPIAKIAARLAVGYALEEIPNDITRRTPASFEPTIDYVVVKMPRFAFEKFPFAEGGLTTPMKSVGEVMAIGRTFKQAFMKAMRSRELDVRAAAARGRRRAARAARAPVRRPLRAAARGARARGASSEDGASAERTRRSTPGSWPRWRRSARGEDPEDAGCGASSSRSTPAPPSSRPRRRTTTRARSARAGRHEVRRGDRAERRDPRLGPNRIGQGIEFDYCCVHAAMTVRESGRDAVMINCNPETVSTDYDTSDRLYFEPLTVEDVLEVIEVEQPEGVIVQFGGQTPLRLAAGLADAGVPLLGTPVDSIDLAEDRRASARCSTSWG